MTTNLDSIKAEYLSLFNASIPRLKELAIALRGHDSGDETNPQSSPNDQEGNRSEFLYSNLKTNTALVMDKLAKLEALLGLILASMDSHEDNSAISLALDLTQDAFEILDVKIDLPISSL